jgi:hypothetical protein
MRTYRAKFFAFLQKKMTACKTKTDVDLADEPPIPDSLRRKMVRITRGAKRILIREPTGKSFKQTNAIILTTDSARAQPEEHIDAIVETAATIMHARWLKRNEDEEVGAMTFQIAAERLPGSPGRVRPSFEFVWDPDEDDGSPLDDLDAYRDDVLLELLDRTHAQGDAMAAHIEELHAVIIDQAKMQMEPIAASSRMYELGAGLVEGGINLQTKVMTETFSREAARAEEEEKTKRSEAMFDRLDKYFAFASTAVGSQLGDFLKRKFGGGNAATEAEMRRGKKAATQTEKKPDDEDDEDDDPDAIEHPVALMCECFGSSLTPQQRKKMREFLETKTMDLFDELFCAETDDEAIELFRCVRDSIGDDPRIPLELAALLDPEQTELYTRVSQVVAKADASDENEDEDASESGDEEEPDGEDDA